MEKIIIEISYTGNNFGAYLPELPGCIATGDSFDEVKENIQQALALHLKSSLKDGDPIPEVFKGEYEITYKMTPEALLNAYGNIFTKAALSRVTGINERQLWHYAAGVRKPREKQCRRIEEGLRNLAKEILSIEL